MPTAWEKEGSSHGERVRTSALLWHILGMTNEEVRVVGGELQIIGLAELNMEIRSSLGRILAKGTA